MSLSAPVSKWKAKFSRRPLARLHDHENVVERLEVVEASKTEIEIALEKAFYGEPTTLLIEQQQRALHTLRNVWVVGKQGYVYFDENSLFSANPLLQSVPDHKLWRPTPYLSRQLQDPVFHLIGRNATNRAHFLVEQLPRLVVSLKALESKGPYKILLSPGAASWQRAWIKKMGIPTPCCVEADKGSMFCTTLYYTPDLLTARQNRMSAPAHYRMLRDLIMPATSTPAIPEERPSIFLSRQDAQVRRLLNEDEVFELCADVFPSLRRQTLAGLSLDEQLALFQKAAVVIGPHGQPFRNSLFSHDATIVQLSDGSHADDFDNKAWADIFSSLAILSGNRAMTLYTGKTSAGTTADWIYPTSRLQEQLTTLKKLL